MVQAPSAGRGDPLAYADFVLLLHIMGFQETGDGCANGWKEIHPAKLRKPAPLLLVLYGIFEHRTAVIVACRPSPTDEGLVDPAETMVDRTRLPAVMLAGIAYPD